MATYLSGGIYFSGIGNGTDFGNIVDQLKKVESIPMQRMEMWKADWKKRYDAFGYVISAVRDAKDALSTLNSPQKFLLKTASSSNASVLSARANAGAADGSHTIEVKQLASNAIWASTQTFASKTSNINNTATAQDFTYTYKGTTRSVSVPRGTTLEGFANLINQDSRNPGVRVGIIQVAGGYTFQVQGQSSGAQAALNISPSNLFGGSGTASSVWQANIATVDPSAAFADSGPAMKPYTYKVTMGDGFTEYTIGINGNKTQQELADAINIQAGAGTATFANGRMVLADVKSVEITAGSDPSTTVNGTEINSVWTTSLAGVAGNTIQPNVVPELLNYSFTMADGTTNSLSITSDKNMNDLIAWINDPSNLGAGAASLEVIDGKQYLKLNNVNSASGFGVQGQVVSSSQWTIQRATDAIFKVDNWPQDLVSSSNTVENVLQGVTLTLTDIGTARISVAADTESVKKNIQAVLDTLNLVIKTVQELTKYDDKKQVASSDPSKSNYSASQFDREKGSVLTGNYGVQLFNTRLKTLSSGTPPGFSSIQGGNLFSGDFVATLSQIGIKTCTEPGNPNYGLFMVAPPGGSQQMQLMDMDRFDKALSENLEDVVRFFAADDEGSSSSASFRYNGHIKGITKAGSYNVSYSVDSNGNPYDVKINGVTANPSDEAGVYTVGQAGDATGLSIKIDDFSVGTHTGKVSIKQGKVRQMEDFFTSELVYYEPNAREPMIGAKNGALMILQANYQQIMDNIDKKIEREQTRLDVWERTQRLAFSRLETLLGKYERSQSNLQSQLAKLGTE